MLKLTKALLIVDVQNDFCLQGALPVPRGDAVVAALNKYIKLFSRKQLPIFASRDWHPRTTTHFKRFGGQWPVHCLADTKGALFHPGLLLPAITIVLSKGMDPHKDSYSAFQAIDTNGRDFIHLLWMFGIKELYVGGLATDYCVRSSVLDALKQGFKVKLLADAIKGVDREPGDSAKAVKEMLAAGAKSATFETVAKALR